MNASRKRNDENQQNSTNYLLAHTFDETYYVSRAFWRLRMRAEYISLMQSLLAVGEIILSNKFSFQEYNRCKVHGEELNIKTGIQANKPIVVPFKDTETWSIYGIIAKDNLHN